MAGSAPLFLMCCASGVEGFLLIVYMMAMFEVDRPTMRGFRRRKYISNTRSSFCVRVLVLAISTTRLLLQHTCCDA